MPEPTKEPVVRSWMPPEEQTFRKQVVTYLQTAGKLDILPGPIREYDVFSQGESSVVFKVASDNGTFVVKMNRVSGIVENEASFFRNWQEQGIATPQVLTVHSANDLLPVSLSVLEFINAPLLETISTESRISQGLSREMGRTLALIHRSKGNGFGYPLSTDPQVGTYATFTEEMGSILTTRFYYLQEKGIINDEDIRAITKAVAVLQADIASGTKPSLTHNDFCPYNIFATHPITVFDPNPRITHPAMCLALSLLKAEIETSGNGSSEAREILSGYRQVSAISDPILSAAGVLRSAMTLHTWARKDKMDKIKKLIPYMRDREKKY